MTNRIAPKSPGLTSLPKLGPALLEDRQSLRSLSRDDFARLPKPKTAYFAPNLLVVFSEKYSATRNALTPGERAMLERAASMILKEGNESHLDDLRSSLQTMSKSGRVADKAFLAELSAKAPQLEPAPKGWTAKRTAPAARETRTESPRWPMPGSPAKKYDYGSIDEALQAGAQWSLMDKSYMIGRKQVTIAPAKPSDNTVDRTYERYDPTAGRWRLDVTPPGAHD